ncbi:MAG: serine/threonine protein kinase, partial [Polyangiales bacterium]
MAEGNDRRLDPTARNRHASGEDRPHGRDERDERFSRPKEIPDHILDGIELPSAPCDEPRPVPGKSAKVRRPSSRPVAGLLRKARPAPAPASLSGPGPRRPGQRVPSKPAVRETTSNTLLSGAQLFQKGAELPAIGEFAGYQVLGRLAIGGMAEILLARQPGQAEPIVLKKILATFDSDDEFVEMFLDEARVGMQLEHPNIGHFLDAGEERGRYFIAMEWVNGVTLAKLVRRASKSGGIPPTIASAIVRAVADALHYAHTSRDENDDLMGLIHRDVSPHNIMVGYDGTVKLLDFGIAKAMGAAHITAAGVVKGKFAYMAPEQCEGEAIDFRSDIFALGVVLFEALTGKRLFRRGSDRETVRAIVREPVPSLSEHWVKAPRELEAICSTALNKDPTARFPTSAAM